MKELTTYIAEKLDINKVNLNMFPIDGTLEEIISFILANGFVQYKGKIYTQIIKKFNELGSKCCVIENDIIWWADTSKDEISEDNPIFLFDDDGHEFCCIVDDSPTAKELSREDFLKRVNKRFKF